MLKYLNIFAIEINEWFNCRETLPEFVLTFTLTVNIYNWLNYIRQSCYFLLMSHEKTLGRDHYVERLRNHIFDTILATPNFILEVQTRGNDVRQNHDKKWTTILNKEVTFNIFLIYIFRNSIFSFYCLLLTSNNSFSFLPWNLIILILYILSPMTYFSTNLPILCD